jgi:hypothetical protein
MYDWNKRNELQDDGEMLLPILAVSIHQEYEMWSRSPVWEKGRTFYQPLFLFVKMYDTYIWWTKWMEDRDKFEELTDLSRLHATGHGATSERLASFGCGPT